MRTLTVLHRTTMLALAACGVSMASPVWSASDVPLSAPIVVMAPTHVSQAHARGYQVANADAERKPHGRFEHTRRTSPVVFPGIGQISGRLLRDLALDAAQREHVQQARTAQRALRQTQLEAMREVRALRTQQLNANSLDPRALTQAQQAAQTRIQSQRQAVQNHWLALWDSLTAQQQGKVVEAVKRRDERGTRERRQSRERWQSRPQRG